MENIHSVEQAQAALSQDTRPQYTFTVPDGLNGYVEKITMVEITTAEEVMATKRARQDPIILGFELAKEAVRAVKLTGQAQVRRVNTADGTTDEVYAKMHPKVRQLVMTAYAKLHNNTANVQKDFLDSMEMSIG